MPFLYPPRLPYPSQLEACLNRRKEIPMQHRRSVWTALLGRQEIALAAAMAGKDKEQRKE